MLLDKGKPLQGFPVPWEKYKRGSYFPRFIPLVPYNIVRLRDRKSHAQPAKATYGVDSRSGSPDPMLFHPADHLQVISKDEVKLLRTSPYFILYRLLSIAALSWAQVLNLVDEEIRKHESMASDYSQHRFASEQLQCVVSLLNDIRCTIREHRDLIEVDHGTSWQFPLEEGLAVVLTAIKSSAENDHENLSYRCIQLHEKAQSASQAVLRAAQLLQAERSLGEANEISRLTVLAFFFLPLGFVGTIFGMNVEELSQNPPLWTYFAVAAPVLAITLLSAVWPRVLQWFKNWHFKA